MSASLGGVVSGADMGAVSILAAVASFALYLSQLRRAPHPPTQKANDHRPGPCAPDHAPIVMIAAASKKVVEYRIETKRLVGD